MSSYVICGEHDLRRFGPDRSKHCPVPQDIEPDRAPTGAAWVVQRRDSTSRAKPTAAPLGVDVKRPGLLVATIAKCPMFGGSSESVLSAPWKKCPASKRYWHWKDAGRLIRHRLCPQAPKNVFTAAGFRRWS